MISQPILDDLLRREHQALYRRHLGRKGLAALALMLVVALVVLTLDRSLLLPMGTYWVFRAALTGAIAGGMLLVAISFRKRFSLPAVALSVERDSDQHDNRLINATLFLRHAQADHRKVGQLLLSEVTEAQFSRFQEALHRSHPELRSFVLLNGLLLIGFALLVALDPAASRRSLTRLTDCIGNPATGAFTRILSLQPGNVLIKPGDALTIRARMGGPLPRDVHFEFRGGNGFRDVRRGRRVSPEKNGPSWECRLEQLFQPLRYRVVAPPAISAWYSVDIATPPALVDWRLEVTPPRYTGMKLVAVDKKQGGGSTVVVGSTLALTGTASEPLRRATALLGDKPVGELTEVKGKAFAGTFAVGTAGKLSLRLESAHGIDAAYPIPVVLVPDALPTIVPVDAGAKISITALGRVSIAFRADDDWGVSRTGVELLAADDKGTDVAVFRPAPGTATRHLEGRLSVEASRLSLLPGKSVRIRLFAEDNREPAVNNRSQSFPIEVSLEDVKDAAKDRKATMETSADLLTELIRLQDENIKATQKLLDSMTAGKSVATEPIRDVHAVQCKIQENARSIMASPGSLGDIASRLSELLKREMPAAIGTLDRAVNDSAQAGRRTACGESLVFQKRILAVLTGIKAGLQFEAVFQDRKDLLSLFRLLIAKQQKNLQETIEAQKRAKNASDFGKGLARVEDQIAGELTSFREQSHVLISGPSGTDEFAAKLREACDLLDKEKAFEKMVTAAEVLEGGNLADGVAREREILGILLKALNVLNKWNADQAKEVVAKASEMLKEMDKALKDMQDKQTKIVNATRDLAREGKLDEKMREKLREMDKQQEPMAELVEKMAQDLYQFPELPVCNELNAKMREVFEDVEQAKDSANAPAIEIAVQKEDALLDAIKNTKKRVEDVEMWLPDVPDNIVWNMESFDADEFPNMPLVPLPDELEDIVGNLLDQAKSVAEQSQDTRGTI